MLLRAIWNWRGIWLGAVALVTAGYGQANLPANRGVVFLCTAVVLAVIAWSNVRDALVLPTGATGARQISRRAFTLRFAGIVLAVGLNIGALAVNAADPRVVFGWQGVLWLAAMVTLLRSCAGWEVAGGNENGAELQWHKHEGLVLAGLIILSVCTHVALLQQIPWRFSDDEGYAYIETMRFAGGTPIGLFGVSWEATSLPTMWWGINSLLVRVVGPSLAGVRLGVALVGALTVIPVYAIARIAWDRTAAALAAFAVAVSAAYVHYSRVSIINVTTPFAWAWCFYYLLRGLRSRRPLHFALAGLIAGLGMYTYYATRLLPLLVVAYVIYLGVVHFRACRKILGQLGLVAVGFFIGFGPLLGYFYANPNMWWSRAPSRWSVPPGIPTTWQGYVSDWNIIAPLLWRNFLGFNNIWSVDDVWFRPLLLQPEAALVALGAGLLVWRWRQPASFLILLWGVSVIATGGTLLDAGSIPKFTIWTPGFPAYYLALALPASLWVGATLHAPHRPLRLVAGVLLATALLGDLAANAYVYLVQYPPTIPANRSLPALQGRFIEKVDPDTDVRLVAHTWWTNALSTWIAEMMGPHGSRFSRFYNPSRGLPLVREPGRNLAFAVSNDLLPYLPILEHYYPGGRTRKLTTPNGQEVAISYSVPASEAWRRYGVLATIRSERSDQGWQWSGVVPAIGVFPENQALPSPLLATWSGAFHVDAAEEIALRPLEPNAGVTARVQGQPLPFNAPLSVEAGWIPFTIEARLARPARVRVALREGANAVQELDERRLWPQPPNQGLAATFDGSPARHRIDPFIGATTLVPQSQPRDFHSPDVDRDSFTLLPTATVGTRNRWEGEVLTEEGTYRMELTTDGRAELDIDGVRVAGVCGPTTPDKATSTGQVLMNAGWHRVRLDFEPVEQRSNGLTWMWTRPDGIREIVPPRVLRPLADSSGQVSWPEVPSPISCTTD